MHFERYARPFYCLKFLVVLQKIRYWPKQLFDTECNTACSHFHHLDYGLILLQLRKIYVCIHVEGYIGLISPHTTPHTPTHPTHHPHTPTPPHTCRNKKKIHNSSTHSLKSSRNPRKFNSSRSRKFEDPVILQKIQGKPVFLQLFYSTILVILQDFCNITRFFCKIACLLPRLA